MAIAFDLDKTRAAVAAGSVVTFRNVHVTSAVVDGKPVLFATDKRKDPIQKAHRNGRFYEAQELDELRSRIPRGGVFVDIGANVGNHSLFMAMFLGAERVIPFEPNPLAYKLLLANVALNRLGPVFDLDHIGLGLSDRAGGGYAMAKMEKNLGGAKMLPGEGDIEVTTGDAALEGVDPGFIKIDVEGMELGVLRGLERTIARARPWIFIEVDNENGAGFEDWVAAHGYTVNFTHQRYKTNKNYLLDPGKET